MIFKAKKVHDINEHVTETHKRPSLGKKVASAFKDAKQVFHKMANKWKNGRSHTPETVSKRVEKGFDTCTVPSVDDTTQQVEETCPSSGASPKENGGVWKMLKQLKERILASGPAIRKAFKKFKKLMKEGCVLLCCLLYVCSFFAGLILVVYTVIMGLVPWYIPVFFLVYLIVAFKTFRDD